MPPIAELLINGQVSGPVVIFLSRWDGRQAKVFPSKRDRFTKQAVVFQPDEIPAELETIRRIMSEPGARGGTYRVDFAPPEQAQDMANAIARELEAAAQGNSVPLFSHGFSADEIERFGIVAVSPAPRWSSPHRGMVCGECGSPLAEEENTGGWRTVCTRDVSHDSNKRMTRAAWQNRPRRTMQEIMDEAQAQEVWDHLPAELRAAINDH